MTISTKTGDKGQTSLWSGQRVSKDAPQVEAYGTLDELNAFLGEAKHYLKSKENQEIIEIIQQDLIKLMGELATLGKPFKDPIASQEIDTLTTLVAKFEETIKIDGFVTPGKTIASAKLDICRTVARRAERRIVTFAGKKEVSAGILEYVNRLSDVLYLMARSEEM
jgi:ATP:cob(I)alamin adenosyltransferase